MRGVQHQTRMVRKPTVSDNFICRWGPVIIISKRAEALKVLAEIPTAYVRLHVAVTAPRRKRGGGVRVSGGVRDYMPLNVEADAFSTQLRDIVFNVYREVAELLELPRNPVSIQTVCNTLAGEAGMWTLAEDADEWLDTLTSALRKANRICGMSEEAARLPQTVCPNCLSLGGMYFADGNGEDESYGCDKCGFTWSPEEYRAGVIAALDRAA